jgi:L-2-hydroxyglutarate oxidase LhgO
MNAYSLPLKSRSSLPVPLAALLAGAALSAGVFALADTDEFPSLPAKVIVVEAPASPSQGVAAKNEASVARAITVGPELRGSKASAIASTPSSTVPQTDEPALAGPRGLASSLGSR